MEPKKNSHVLVIDDDKFLLHAIKKGLELANYKVTVSSSVHDAYFKIGVVKPDVVMLDVIMPDMNGVEFMHLINSYFAPVYVPIVLMSFLPKKDLYNMGYNIGNTYYFNKPF